MAKAAPLMRVLWLLLLVATPVQAGLAEAVGWLQEQPPSVAASEALHSAGVDTWQLGWYGRLAVPANDPADPNAPVRAMHAIATSGYDPRHYPDPLRGDIDLVAQWQANGPAVAESRGATMAFHALAGHAMGAHRPDAVLAALVGLQDGGFPCERTGAHPDCTGFAVAALTAWDQPFDTDAAAAYLWGRYDGGTFGSGNANTQAWCLIALQRLGHEIPQEAWQVLAGWQEPSGRVRHGASEGAGALATADAVLAWSGFPGPRFAPIVVEISSKAPGRVLRVEGWDQVTWTVDGHVRTGDTLRLDDAAGKTVYVHAQRPGEHARARLSWPGEDTPMPVWPIAVLFLLAQRRKRA